ncbi:MAG: thiamine pyrophosphate-dependent dehydrogenase E1 component subunit alpha [Chloroflexi bacterium]|nr:thiamine pyrophosphate-dependent dehydrogenase E1 component subunit alpha [Chloroflexota bacterium]
MNEANADLLRTMYQVALTIRRFEEAAIGQYRLWNIRGYFHPYIGEEAIAVGVISALQPDDYIVSTHRGHGHAIAKGHDTRLVMAELFGKATGYCKGRGGSMHVSNLGQFNLGANGIVGGGIPLATGAAMGMKQKGSRQVVVSFFSDGASNNGVFHECVNMAAIYRLPILYVIENNHYAVSTPVEQSTLLRDLSKRSESYGIPGLSLDGNDALRIYQAMAEPLRRARVGEGPTLIECKTYRHGGHHINDPGAYMPKEDLARWKAHDPIDVLRDYLAAAGVTEAAIQTIKARVEEEVAKAVEFASQSPQPSEVDFLQEIASL